MIIGVGRMSGASPPQVQAWHLPPMAKSRWPDQA